MAITWNSLQLIMQAKGRQDELAKEVMRVSTPNFRAASAGYPDLLLTQPQIERVLNGRSGNLTVRPDSQQIAQWHGKPGLRVYESSGFFHELGYELEVFDVKEIRGGEQFMDLNKPLWPQYRRKYDLVIDSGTCEHCFHIGQAIMNLADMCKAGGHIVQAFPLNAFNHGFYCVSPTLVRDFYEDNGFVIEECYGVSGEQKFKVSFMARFQCIPENSYMLSLIRRNTEQELSVPVQFKYREDGALAAKREAKREAKPDPRKPLGVAYG